MLDRVTYNAQHAIPTMADGCRRRQDVADPLFFAVLCRYLWGANAPKELQFALARNRIEAPDRTCRAWASGTNKPPLEVYLLLQRDEIVGSRVHDFVMFDCTASWWHAMRRAIKVGTAAIEADE
jgi:hypothetical protein